MKKVPITNSLLRKAREGRGWTQRRLAADLNVDEQTVRSWERGTRQPSLEIRSRLCKTFELSPEQLGLQLYQETPSSPTLVRDSSFPSSTHENTSEQKDIRLARELPMPIVLNQADQNRKRMLKRVHSRWIAGILEHSLYHSILIPLRLREQPDAVENPWQLAVGESILPPHSLPTGTRIIHVYDDADGELLILGEPGAGKTTLLLELARDLLERAAIDHTHPIPVVFNLSSWMERRQSVSEWLIEELNSKYQVPHKVGKEWLINNQILPLLDGLDEVAEIHHTECVEAINLYRQEHGFVPMIVCSRSTNYLAQTTRILLRTSVMVQPLSQEQITNYILHAGKDLDFLQRALENDPVLLELATSPLMLNILALTVGDHDYWNETLLIEGSLIERHRLVFQQYTERVLHRGPQSRYTAEETKRWLTWLAQQMQSRGQTEFYIERLQPDWLPERSRRSYYTFVIRFLNGFGHVIVYMLFAWLVGGSGHGGDALQNGIFGLLGGSPGDTILGWMGGGIVGGFRAGGSLGLIFALVLVLCSFAVRFASSTEWSWSQVWRGLFRGLMRGLPPGLLISALSGTLIGVLQRNITTGISTGLGYGLLGSLTYGLIYGFAFLIENNRLSDEIRMRRGGGIRVRLGDALIIGTCSWAGFALVDVFEAGWYYALVYGFTLALGISLVFAFDDRFVNSLGGGFGAEIKPTERLIWSWAQFRINMRHDVVRGLMVGFSMMVTVGIMIGLSSGISHGSVLYGATYGLVDGFVIGVILASVVILTFWLYHGWSSSIVEEHDFFKPNEGIRRSLRYSVFSALAFGGGMGVFSGIIISFAFGVIGQLSTWFVIGAGFTIIFGLIFMNLFGLAYGGVAVTAHVILRLSLWRQRVIPLDYSTFLDDAAERILLRKIGGGYMFVHSQLRDYFALLDKDEEKNGNSKSQA